MSQAQLLDYARMCLILVLRLSLIPIIVATVIGILVSLLQALTQIQEQTLGFAVKLIAISLTLLACASWMGSSLLLYTQDIFSHFALLRLCHISNSTDGSWRRFSRWRGSAAPSPSVRPSRSR